MNQKGNSSHYRDEEGLKKVGAKIREIRMSKGISQEAFANSCDINYTQINRMELGKVNFSISNLFRIVRALELDLGELL